MSGKPCSSPGSASPSCEKNVQDGATIWILAEGDGYTRFFAQKPDAGIMPFSIGCCCARHAGHAQNMARYMDAALACGQYDGLVLVGDVDKLQDMKDTLSSPVQSRIIAEINRDLYGISEDKLQSVVKSCVLL
ncbi:MAG: hypothetical protein CMH27_04275 [Micavibrio sp.]|nr:hypothetical protein [Micavibrio sp.]|tara:strand:- start:905 stop:1303 length:399 start_codon:yes stop_codon:yes gene_type:complete